MAGVDEEMEKTAGICGAAPTKPTTGAPRPVAVTCPTSHGTPTFAEAPEQEKVPPRDAPAADGPRVARDASVWFPLPPKKGHGADVCGAIVPTLLDRRIEESAETRSIISGSGGGEGELA